MIFFCLGGGGGGEGEGGLLICNTSESMRLKDCLRAVTMKPPKVFLPVPGN